MISGSVIEAIPAPPVSATGVVRPSIRHTSVAGARIASPFGSVPATFASGFADSNNQLDLGRGLAEMPGLAREWPSS